MAAVDRSSSPQAPPIEVVSRTNILYWWPVWMVGFVLAGITYLEDSRLVIVPGGSKVTASETDRAFNVQVPHAAPDLVQAAEATEKGKTVFPIRISLRKGMGIIWFAIILLVIFATNIPLRGLSTVVALLLLVLGVVLLSTLELWTPILEFLGGLHIQLSLAAYLLPSTALLILWLVVVFLYDPLRYARFTPGQVALRQAIGSQVEIYPTIRIHVEKRQTDLLRHWILGFGAGDLMIQIPGKAVPIEMPNVLFVDSTLAKITTLIKLQTVDVT